MQKPVPGIAIENSKEGYSQGTLYRVGCSQKSYERAKQFTGSIRNSERKMRAEKLF